MSQHYLFLILESCLKNNTSYLGEKNPTTYNTTLSEQYENPIEKSKQKGYLIQKYTTAHFPGLVQKLHEKVAGLN
jgi:hypothetical protein